MENIIAIDVGTGFAKAAVFYDGLREPMLLIPPEMPMGMSSVAYLTAEGEIKVSPKGRPVNCTPIRNIKTCLNQKTLPIAVGEKTYDIEPGRVYGAIALELIKLANETLVRNNRKPAYKVVVTYPAAFIHSQNPRLMTKNVELMKDSIEALELDGQRIEVVKMLPEPVAAAYDSIYYERNIKDNPVTADHYNIAVYDLGHGTFDAAVVTSTDSTEDPFDVVCQDGDPEIGGRIFDDKIYGDLCKQLGYPDKCTLSARDQEELHYSKAVNIKHGFTNQDEIYETFMPTGAEEYAELKMTKAQFERLIATDLRNTLIKTVEVLERAKQKGVKVNEIVLTGGSSHISAIEKMLSDAFGGQGITVRVFRPENAVVYGAARYAHNLEAAPITQHAEYSYGIFMDKNERVHFLVNSDDVIPERSKAYELTPNDCTMTVRVCRSKSTFCTAEDLDYKACHEVRRFRFDTQPHMPHRFYLNVDDTHKVAVECEYPDGKTVVKSKFED